MRDACYSADSGLSVQFRTKRAAPLIAQLTQDRKLLITIYALPICGPTTNVYLSGNQQADCREECASRS